MVARKKRKKGKCRAWCRKKRELAKGAGTDPEAASDASFAELWGLL